MQITGYRRACGKRSGGIRSVALVAADAVAGVQYDADEDCYTAVTLAAGKAFAVYRFREDGAHFREKAVSNGLDVLVSHTLTLVLERMDGGSAAAVGELCRSAGVLAIVTTNNDVSVLVGYSRKFGAGYPLRLQAAVGDSGRTPADISAETVVLSCVDTEKARIYAGTVPQ